MLPLVDDAFAVQLPAFLSSQPTAMTIAVLEGQSVAARFDDLAQTASGDYVQWVLPGAALVPGKLVRMVCALEGDPALTFVTSNAQGEDADTFALPVTEPFMQADGTQIANALRASGQRLSGGLTAPLFRRADMERRHWLASAFPDGRPDDRRLRDLMLPGSLVGVMQAPQVIAGAGRA